MREFVFENKGLGFTEYQPPRIRRHALKAITRMDILISARVVCALHSRCRMRSPHTRRHVMTHCSRWRCRGCCESCEQCQFTHDDVRQMREEDL